jgi:hypothetical protein
MPFTSIVGRSHTLSSNRTPGSIAPAFAPISEKNAASSNRNESIPAISELPGRRSPSMKPGTSMRMSWSCNVASSRASTMTALPTGPP